MFNFLLFGINSAWPYYYNKKSPWWRFLGRYLLCGLFLFAAAGAVIRASAAMNANRRLAAAGSRFT